MPRTARVLHRGNDLRRPHARSRPPDHRRSARRSRRHEPLAVASVRPTDRTRNAGRCCRGVRVVQLGDDGKRVYGSLVEGTAARTLDDGEAATIAYAHEAGAVALIDEKKAQ